MFQMHMLLENISEQQPTEMLCHQKPIHAHVWTFGIWNYCDVYQKIIGVSECQQVVHQWASALMLNVLTYGENMNSIKLMAMLLWGYSS